MKTTQKKFEELLSVLKLNYHVEQIDGQTATISSDTSDQYLKLIFDENTVTVYAGDEVDQVLYLNDELSVGVRVLDIENILIRYLGLKHGPLALSTYLYCTLLGMLWGIKASPQIRDQDPVPQDDMFIRLYGHKNDTVYYYDYCACTDGTIKITEHCNQTPDIREYSFHPVEYVTDPEKIVINFFSFFKDIDSIDSAGRG